MASYEEMEITMAWAFGATLEEQLALVGISLEEFAEDQQEG